MNDQPRIFTSDGLLSPWGYGGDRSIERAILELQNTDEAVALANVAAVARKESAELDVNTDRRDALNACIDCFALAREALDDLITLAGRSYGLERTDLPETGAIIDILVATDSMRKAA